MPLRHAFPADRGTIYRSWRTRARVTSGGGESPANRHERILARERRCPTEPNRVSKPSVPIASWETIASPPRCVAEGVIYCASRSPSRRCTPNSSPYRSSSDRRPSVPRCDRRARREPDREGHARGRRFMIRNHPQHRNRDARRARTRASRSVVRAQPRTSPTNARMRLDNGQCRPTRAPSSLPSPTMRTPWPQPSGSLDRDRRCEFA